MGLEGGKRQMSLWELPSGSRGEAPMIRRSDESPTASGESNHPGEACLLEEALARSNLKAALKRVVKNRGSPGIDGMTVDDLRPYLREHWTEIRASLLDGTYRPQSVKRQEIPKRGGGVRVLGIPTVLDRFIQQALLQVLQPRLDPSFSEHSFGFRPGRSAHGAVRRAQGYVRSGRNIVVDVDLEKFFDRVNHDVLMGRLAKRVEDRRVLRLIRRYLESGVMADGVVVERYEGTLQGGPLSPLLANVLLDEVDKELERRGHSFVRYADDINVYVRSNRAGQRVMALLRRLFASLRLPVNESKSAVASVFERTFLGFVFRVDRHGVVRLGVAPKALGAWKDRIRWVTRRSAGRSMHAVVEELRSFIPGWRAYFGLAETPRVFADLDGWVRRRLRALQLNQWKRGRTVFRELRARGASVLLAGHIAHGTARWWWNAGKRVHHVLTNSYFDQLGLPRLAR